MRVLFVFNVLLRILLSPPTIRYISITFAMLLLSMCPTPNLSFLLLLLPLLLLPLLLLYYDEVIVVVRAGCPARPVRHNITLLLIIVCIVISVVIVIFILKTFLLLLLTPDGNDFGLRPVHAYLFTVHACTTYMAVRAGYPARPVHLNDF